MQVDIAESGEFVNVLASLPGYRSAQVILGIDSQRLLIYGCHEASDPAEKGRTSPVPHLSSRSCASDEGLFPLFCFHVARERIPMYTTNMNRPALDLFCALELPMEVNPKNCTAILSKGLLGIRLSKVHSSLSTTPA